MPDKTIISNQEKKSRSAIQIQARSHQIKTWTPRDQRTGGLPQHPRNPNPNSTTHWEPSDSTPGTALPGRASGGRFWHGSAVHWPPVWTPGKLAWGRWISWPSRCIRCSRWTVGAEEMRDDDHIEFERLLSPEDVARACGLSRRAVYRAIARGELRAARLCHRLRVPPAELERWIAEETCSSEPPAPMPPRCSAPSARRGSLRAILDEATDGLS